MRIRLTTALNLASNSYTVITILLYDNLLDLAYWEDTIRLSHFRKVAPPLPTALQHNPVLRVGRSSRVTQSPFQAVKTMSHGARILFRISNIFTY